MKKTITIILSIILLINLICVKSFAVEEDENVGTETLTLDNYYKESGMDEIGTEGFFENEVELKNDNDETIKANTRGTTFTSVFTFKTLIQTFSFFIKVTNEMMCDFSNIGNKVSDGIQEIKTFTIYNMVMGHCEVFNIDYINIPEKPNSETPAYDVLKYYVINFYNILRNFSIAISLFVLIYVGIRMATSTIASEKAKYNKMLIDWIASLMLLLAMHFIVIIISFLLKWGLGVVDNIATSLNIVDVEKIIFKSSMKNLSIAKGWNAFVPFIELWVLVYFQAKFFIMYVQRILEIGFLVVISPLVTITYPIDKIGDGKAQAFQAWFGQLTSKALVQLVHAIIYCVFIASAGVIAQNHPLVAILFFMTLSRAEKIVRNIFAVKDDAFQKVKVPFTKGKK